MFLVTVRKRMETFNTAILRLLASHLRDILEKTTEEHLPLGFCLQNQSIIIYRLYTTMAF